MWRRVWSVAAVLCVVLGVAVSAAHGQESPPGGCCGPQGTGSAPPPPPSPPGPPDYYTWKTPPRIVLHTSEFTSGPSPMTNSLAMVDAIVDVVNSFNDVGGIDTYVKEPIQLSTAPFTPGQWYHDSTPTIHVGFVKTVGAWDHLTSDNARGVTIPDDKTADLVDGKYLKEVHIAFPDTAVRFQNVDTQPWSFATPPSTSSLYATHPFYDAGSSDTTAVVAHGLSAAERAQHGLTSYASEDNLPRLWFRPAFLHELLHAFGRWQHVENDYSFLNNSPGTGGYPWANRASDDAVRPLPEDARWLRHEYVGANAGSDDISVLDTWYEQQPDDSSKSEQVALCQPSLGTAWSSSVAGAPVFNGGPGVSCGTDQSVAGSSLVCPGQTVRTRFAVANRSPGSLSISAQFALSTDEHWDSTDAISTTTNQQTVAGETSKLWEVTWKVPDYPGSTARVLLHPLVRITAPGAPADWIPLRGSIQPPTGGCS